MTLPSHTEASTLPSTVTSAEHALSPLACPGCGRPVPIGVGDVARCDACATDVAIPERHITLRAAAALDDDARARADAIAIELTRPPSLAMRVWHGAGNVSAAASVLLLVVWLLVSLVMCIGSIASAGFPGALIVLVVGLVLGIPLLYDEALHGLAGPLGTDLADVWGGAGSYGRLGLAFYLVLAMPRVLARYAASFESVRAMLRRALSAPTRLVGGGAECRSCGAPIHVPADAVHVRCIYCRADNLVLASDAGLSQLHEGMQITCDDLEAALREEQRVAAEGRSRAAKDLAKGLLLVPLFVLLGRGVAGINDDGTTFWHRAVASSPMVPRIPENPSLPAGEPTRFDVRDTFDGCDPSECWAYYFVALGRGEAVEITSEEGELSLSEVARRHVGRWYDPTYEWRPMEPGARAPYAGWYRVRLVKRRGTPDPRVTWTRRG